MTAALTGALGWSGAHPFQLGGPPVVGAWTRPIPKFGTPYLAHAYQNDGVTPLGTFAVRTRPAIKVRTTNGGFDPLTLAVRTGPQGSVYGAPIYGSSVYGGTSINLTQGNVVRLTEVGGPWPGFVYSGVVESLPETRSSKATSHQIVLAPFGAELARVGTPLAYVAQTDIAQVVRDAVSLTQHCSCDQVSVPAQTGISLATASGGTVDFTGQTVQQVLDTLRSMAGPTWFWFVDELGRVWFQFQGASATYTFTGGVHYQQRTYNGGDIGSRINQITAIGGVPQGGSANATAVVNGSSQALIGVRALNPPIALPGISDQPTLAAIAQGILGTLDQTWNRVQLDGLPPTGAANERHPGRVHGSQPGGAVIRYWEPTVNPQGESGVGAGYVGPFICQTIQYDGMIQAIEAGNIPITSSTDISNMVLAWAARAAAIGLNITAAALNLPQTLTGTFQSGPSALTPGVGAGVAAQWSLSQQMFQAFDPLGIPRFQAGNMPQNGISPAQWGGRINGPDGVTLFDGVGAVGLPKRLAEVIQTSAVQGTNSAFADVSGGVTPTFTLSRQSNVLVFAMGRFAAQPANTGNLAFLGLRCGSDTTSGAPAETDANTTAVSFVPFCLFFWDTLAAGSYTAALQASAQGGVGAQYNVAYLDVIVFQFGG